MQKQKIRKILMLKTPDGRSFINKAAIAEILDIPRQNLTKGIADDTLAEKHYKPIGSILNKILK